MPKNIEQTIRDLFKKNGVSYDYDVTETTITIFVEWGDWKHDHHYIDHIMKSNGFEKTGEETTEEDGSDTYSSEHYYRVNE